MLQPILVGRRSAKAAYELIAGERRWRAARRVGLQTIPALVRATDDAAALEHALVENLHRDNLNLLEEAAAYQQLIEDFGLTHDEVAAGSVAAGRRSPTTCGCSSFRRRSSGGPGAQALDGPRPSPAREPDRGFQEHLAKRAVAEDLSVRAVEEAVREHQGDTERRLRRRGGTVPTAPAPLRPPGCSSSRSCWATTSRPG